MYASIKNSIKKQKIASKKVQTLALYGYSREACII